MAGLGDMFGASLATVNGQKPRNSDRIQAGQPLNLRGAFEAATNIPVVGDALSGGMAMYDAANGEYGSAAMNAIGVLPFVSAGMVKGVGKASDALKNPTKHEIAHETARKNAVDMLGLPETNTAMDRARAMGFETETPLYRGTQSNELDHTGRNVWVTDSPAAASDYALDMGRMVEGGNVMPVYGHADLIHQDNAAPLWNGGNRYQVPGQYLRSTHAAFDPARRHEADLLGNINPQLLGAMGIGSVGAAAAATQLPDEYKSAIANAFGVK